MLAQAAGREMLKRKSGCIINVASIAGFQGNVNGPHYAGYAASKAGVMGLTRDLATAWGRDGIRVNAIAPGYMETDNTEALRKDPKRSQQILERIPAGRCGTPQDVAGAAVFLSSPAANYIHGHVLAVDGGWLAR